MALDIGSRRVGVAICDVEETLVTALDPLAYRGPQRLAEEVARLVGELGIGGLVVGIPRTRGGQGRGEQRVAAVVAALQTVVSVSIALEDERGSTAAAESLLAEAGVPRRRWTALVDSLAAKLILEGYIANARRGCRDGIDLPAGGC